MTHYEVLGVEPTATVAEIRAAYVAKARRLHPDRHAGAAPADVTRAQRAMQEVNAAWTVLSDPRARRDYDASLRAREPIASTSSVFTDATDGSPSARPAGPPPVVLPDWDDEREGHLGPRLPSIVRIGPVVVLLAVLAAIFVITAFAAGDRSVDVPRPAGRVTPAVGACVDVSGNTVSEVPCETPNALRIQRLAPVGDQCRRGGEVPIQWDADTVLCVQPPS